MKRDEGRRKAPAAQSATILGFFSPLAKISPLPILKNESAKAYKTIVLIHRLCHREHTGGAPTLPATV
jgi:hypothetical protein